MIFFLLIVIALIAAVTSFTLPWVSIIAYNVMSIMQPQSIWFWAFQDFPVFKIFAGLSLFSFIIAILKKKVDLKSLKNSQNYAVLSIFILCYLSVLFSPFSTYTAYLSSDLILSNLNIIVLFYFVSQLILNKDESYIKYMIFGFMFVIIYYVYWSNSAYFSFDFSKFNNGRLQGPNHGPYHDENKFATVFVIGLPFFMFAFFYAKKIYLKIAIALIGPLLLHSIFLTGSRGALLAVGITVLMTSKMIKSKKFSIILLVAFFAAVAFQASTTLNRSEESVNAAQSKQEVNPRIRSWTIGLNIIKEYPILGVGIQRFQYASRLLFPEYNSGYVAHNTFLQIAAESGLLSGLLYLYIYYFNYKQYKKAVRNNVSDYPFLDYANKSIFVSLTGFYVCSIFLNLLIFEGFYFLLMLSTSTHFLLNKKIGQKRQVK